MFICDISLGSLVNRVKMLRHRHEASKVNDQLVHINKKIPSIIEDDSSKFKNNLALKVLTKLNQGLLVFDDDYMANHQTLVVDGLKSAIIGIYGGDAKIFDTIRKREDPLHMKITSFVEECYKERLKKLYEEHPKMSMSEKDVHLAFSTSTEQTRKDIFNFLESSEIQDKTESMKNDLRDAFKIQLKDSYNFIKKTDDKEAFIPSNTPSLSQGGGTKYYVPSPVEMRVTKIMDTTPDIGNFEALDKAIIELTAEGVFTELANMRAYIKKARSSHK